MNGVDATPILGKIDAYLAKPPITLFFDREIEAIFVRDRSAMRARQAYLAGLIAVLAFNVMLCVEYASGEIEPTAAVRVLVASHAIVTIPCLVFAAVLRRNASAKLRELLMALGYGLVTVGSVVLNQNLRGEAAVYDAFTSVLIPITCNIALPMAFVTAALGSAFGVAALTVSAFLHAGFSPDAQSAMATLYGAGAVMTLVANYRFELAERTNYLNYLRESLRNADIARANRHLTQLSRTDFLTGLPNRRDFDERLAVAVRRSCEEGRPLTVLVLDIDNFKLYNDVYGHLEGDGCLRRVAQAIAGAAASEGCFAGRIGGEEFAVALPGAEIETAGVVADRIRGAVRALKIQHRGLGDRRYVTISVGVAALNPLCPEEPVPLLARADAALYKAKRDGRDKIEIDLRSVA